VPNENELERLRKKAVVVCLKALSQLKERRNISVTIGNKRSRDLQNADHSPVTLGKISNSTLSSYVGQSGTEETF
jgi:hypothetical protein